MVIELVAGLGIGFGIGYGLDTLLGTMPLFLVLFILAGFAAGIKTMLRSAKEVQEKAAKADYSKGFLAAYKAGETLVNAGNNEGAKAQLPAVIGAIQTADDRMAGGGMVFNLGTSLNDASLQMQGLDLMIASGKADAVAFGVPFIANPDLPERVKAGAALNTPDSSTYYTPGAKGYTDYPTM